MIWPLKLVTPGLCKLSIKPGIQWTANVDLLRIHIHLHLYVMQRTEADDHCLGHRRSTCQEMIPLAQNNAKPTNLL